MGSKKLFNIIGTDFFGDVFEILMVLREIMDVLITVAVGMYVGSTVFASHCMNIEKQYAIAEMLKSVNVNKDGTITQDEFIERCKKWIHKGKQLAEDGGAHSRKSLRQPQIEKKQHELVKIEHIMSRIPKHFQNQVLEDEGLVTDDGKPNIDSIKSLFEKFASNKNKLISQSELKDAIQYILNLEKYNSILMG
ncbi:Sodium/calcium exchanger NCL1 [Camellia lanceoleosa]|nr:Sodium/calcium exchanger NCL1 [Camellia lanceoleosa]